jgi:hypothetical protein
MSSNIIACASIFPLIYSFIFLSSLEILADRLNASRKKYIYYSPFSLRRKAICPSRNITVGQYHPMVPLPHSDSVLVFLNISTTGHHLGSSPSTACCSTWTHPLPVSIHPLSDRLRLFSSPIFSSINTPKSHPCYFSTYEDGTNRALQNVGI